MRSPDLGATWSEVTGTPLDGGAVNQIGCNPTTETLIAVGSGYSGGPVAMRSTDGAATWDLLITPADNGSLNFIVFDGVGTWLGGGVDSSNNPILITSTDDGNTWTTAGTTGLDGNYTAATDGAGTWVVAGVSSISALCMATSTDLATWTATPADPAQGVYSSLWDAANSQWLFGTANSAGTIWTTPDLTTFTVRTTPWDAHGTTNSLHTDGSRLVACNENPSFGGGGDKDIAVSTNAGVTWSDSANPFDSHTAFGVHAVFFDSDASAWFAGTTVPTSGDDVLIKSAAAVTGTWSTVSTPFVGGGIQCFQSCPVSTTPLGGSTDVDLVISGAFYALTGHIEIELEMGAESRTPSSLSSWNADTSQQFQINVMLTGTLSAPPHVVPPPPPTYGPAADIVVNLTRVSAIYPPPSLDALSRPVGWGPTSTITEDWGRYQIVFNGVDVTFFRGKATVMGTMTWNEPFADDTVDFLFGQITPWDVPGTGDLWWLVNGVPIEVFHVLPDGTVDYANPMFEGRYMTEEDTSKDRSHTSGSGGAQGTEDSNYYLTAHCLGAIYACDVQIRTPMFVLSVVPDPTNPGSLKAGPDDIGQRIAGELNERALQRLTQLAICQPVNTGVFVSDLGSGTQLINGYIQDQLAQGAVAPVPTPGFNVVGIAVRPDDGGYLLAASDSSVLTFGKRTFFGGSELGFPLVAAFSGIAFTPSGLGYTICAEDGGIFNFGDSPFYGSGSGIVSSTVVDIAVRPQGDGYWIVDDAGHVYSFGPGAVYHGNATPSSDVVGIAATPTGGGYWIVDSTGHVFAMGDAVYHGGASASDIVSICSAGIDVNAYYIAGADGGVFSLGGATFHGNVVGAGLAAPIVDMKATAGGLGYFLAGEDGGVFALGDAVFQGSVPGADGEWEAWTLMKNPGRVPVIRPKNRWTQHATIRAGQPGVILSTLMLDPTTSRNVIYGEGTDTNNHAWRNSKYPNLRPTAPPVFSVTLTLGLVNPQVGVWQSAMHDAGWAISTNNGNLFDGSCQVVCRNFQITNGLLVTGTVNAQTWAATFLTGLNSGDLTGAYIAPLAEDPRVDPWLYDAYGARIGPNPLFDPTIIRTEGWETFGTGVDRDTAIISAKAELMRDYPPAYLGQITLTADPNEMSRYDLRAGMNLMLEGFRGRDVFLHIAQSQIQWNVAGRPVMLTVDEHAQDLITLAAKRTADRSTTDPVRRVRHNRRASRIIPDKVASWDFEAGGGIIPLFVISPGLWFVVRIPAATAGTVVEIDVATLPANIYSLGIFSQPVTPAALSAVLPNPLMDPGDGTSAWDNNPAVDALGLVIGWGQAGDAAGYSPYQQSDSPGGSAAPVTGRLTDQGSWQFQSLVPPWLWVAMWSPFSSFVAGRVFPAPIDQ